MEIVRNTDPRGLMRLKLEEDSFTNEEKEILEKFRTGIVKYIENILLQFFSRADLEKIAKYENAASKLAFYFAGSVEESSQETTRKKTEEKEIDRIKFEKISKELGINLSYTKLW